MKDLLRFARLYRPFAAEVAAGVALSLLASLAGIALMAVSGWFIAAMALAGAAAVTMNYFTPAATIRALAILRTAGRYGERLVNHDAALRVTAEFRARFYAALEPLSPAAVQDLHSGDMFSRLRNDIDTLERFYLLGAVPIAAGLAGLGIVCGVMWLYLPVLAILLAALLLLAGIVLPLVPGQDVVRDAAVIAGSQRQRRIDLSELSLGWREMQLYGLTALRQDAIGAQDRALAAARDRQHRRETAIQAAGILAMGLALAGTLALAVPAVREGGITPPSLAMLALLSLAAFDLVLPLPAAFQSLFAARQAARRVFELVDRQPMVPAVTDGEACGEGPFRLEIKDLVFSYAAAPVLRGVSLSLAAGEVGVICGGSGSGKSTVLNILAGFWPIVGGQVRVCGADLAMLGAPARRRALAFSPQKPYLFADTLRANLLLANPAASDAALDEACRLAGLGDVVASLPQGLDTYVGEHGSRFSGGQLRRLSLARAWLADAYCLILDEPTEGLDAVTEDAVMRGLLAAAAARGKAVLLLLHAAEQPWLAGLRPHILRLEKLTSA